MPDTAARGPALEDVRVLEFGSMLAGPFVGTLLADAEKPGKPDALREWPPHKGDTPLWWKSMARGKQLITLDISKPEGRGIALDLILRSDIVIENFKHGTLERWGFDPGELAKRDPRTIWVRVSGFGQTGPYRYRGGYATIAEGFSGLASFTGFADRGPMVSVFPLGDYLAGVFGALGAMVALRERERSGRGQVVDVSLYEPFLRIIESVVVRYDQTGRLKPRLRQSDGGGRAPQRLCDSGWGLRHHKLWLGAYLREPAHGHGAHGPVRRPALRKHVGAGRESQRD